MKHFKFTFEDKKGNELTHTFIWCVNKQEAIKTAKKLQAESMLNDLHKVKPKVSK